MAKKTETTVEEKLRALFDLQLIDSRVDEIRNVRGELPLEVEDLTDEVAGLNTRLEKLNADLEMIEEGKGLAPLRGYRNLPKGDLSALADALVKLSELALADAPPREAEINPLIVGGEGKGVTAVDGLVIGVRK